MNKIVVENDVETDVIDSLSYFSSPIFKISMPKYIDIVREVGEEVMQMTIEDVVVNELYPTNHSIPFQGHPKISEFAKKVIQLAWDTLKIQGYDMDKFNTFYESMWLQEHHKMSGMDQHIHNNGVQLVGFYFLDVPENSSHLIFHDPRPGKVQINLPEANVENVTFATQMINFAPKKGDLFFTPSWLPHSFSRHGNDEMLKFVHINITVEKIPDYCQKNELSE